MRIAWVGHLSAALAGIAMTRQLVAIAAIRASHRNFPGRRAARTSRVARLRLPSIALKPILVSRQIVECYVVQTSLYVAVSDPTMQQEIRCARTTACIKRLHAADRAAGAD
jgi:hypothetical protein